MRKLIYKYYNNNHKLIIWLFVFIQFLALPEFNSNNVIAQEIKFEDVFDDLDNLTKEQAFTRFLMYQAQDPHFPNTYLQLGYLAERIFLETDPLREIELIDYWTKNAALFYELYNAYSSSTDLRRNRKYYSNLPFAEEGQRLSEEIVISFVTEKAMFTKNYRDSVLMLYNKIEQSKDYYNNCVRIFNEINTSYSNFNEALLKTDDALLVNLDELAFNFKNSVDKFDEYKTLLTAFPLEGYIASYQVQLGEYISTVERRVGAYNQHYKLRPIETFRLDGITNSDFLKDTFYLWDYGSWVNEFRETYNQEIIPLRKEVESIQETFSENERFLSRVDFAEPDMSFRSFDELFLFRLGKFDNNSIVRDLFDFLNVRQDFLQLSKNPVNNPNDSSYVNMTRKLRYYYRYSLSCDEVKQVLNNLNNGITNERIVRFNVFFNKYYDGEQGLRNYCNEQKLFFRDEINNGLNNLNSYFNNVKALRNAYVKASGSRNIEVPLFITNPETEDYSSYSYKTRDIIYTEDFPNYAAGYRSTANSTRPFIAKIDDEQSVKWIKEASFDNGKNPKAECLFAYENGVLALLTDSVYDDFFFTTSFKNKLLHLDIDGNEIFIADVEDDGYPFLLKYDEINQLSIMVFGELDSRNGVPATMSVNLADSLGNVIWQNSLDVKGYVVDVVRSGENYLAVFNYNEFSPADNRRNIIKPDNGWGVLIAEISEEGQIISTTSLPIKESLVIEKVYNISSTEINLIGYAGEPGNMSDVFVYILINNEGEILFSNTE